MHDKKNITEWEKIKKARETKEKNPKDSIISMSDIPCYADLLSEANAKLEEWREFSKTMEEHIIESGKKYDIEGQSCVDIDPWISCISAGRKYLWEIVAWYQNEDWDASKVRENLLKTAHYCQLAYTKLLGGD